MIKNLDFDKLYMYTANNIRYLRRKLGLTQSHVAEKIDKTITTVGDYEKGRSMPPLDVAQKLCEIFQITLDDLVNKDLSKEGPGRPDEEALLKSLKPTAEDEELLRRFLVLKLEEVANALKVEKPELYNRLQLDKLIKKEKNFE